MNFVGQLRYVEIVLVVLLFANLGRALRYIGRTDVRLVSLFFLAALAHIISDFLTDASVDGTLRRVGTYIVLALLVVAVTWLGKRDPDRIRWILLGYSFSYLVVVMGGLQTPIRMYLDFPWRLGLGMALTIATTVAIWWQPRYKTIGAVALLGLGAIHWFADARALAGITAATGVLALWTSIYPRRSPLMFRPGWVVFFVSLAAAGVIALNYGLKVATDRKMFSETMQRKMEMQFANPYGLIGGARGDTIAAAYAVSKRPIFGHGSTNVDPDVWRFYATLSAKTYAAEGALDSRLYHELNKDWGLGTPSHSHVLGAWADAGILAALCWFAILGLSLYVLVRVMVWSNPAAPLFTLIAIATIWDVLFSPGPTRMDMALRVLVLSCAADMVRGHDASRLLRRMAAGVRLPRASC